MWVRTSLALAVALLASACVLTAEQPLFSLADADPAFVLREGLWVVADPACKADPDRSKPGDKTCLDWILIKRAPDGRWQLGDAATPADFTLGVFVELPDAARPGLRVAEVVDHDGTEPSYAVMWPMAEASGRITRLGYRAVSCSDLADPPVEDVTITRSEDGSINGCVARSRAGVFSAARRADAAGSEDIAEMAFVRP